MLMTISEAAMKLGTSPRTIERRIKAGALFSELKNGVRKVWVLPNEAELHRIEREDFLEAIGDLARQVEVLTERIGTLEKALNSPVLPIKPAPKARKTRTKSASFKRPKRRSSAVESWIASA